MGAAIAHAAYCYQWLSFGLPISYTAYYSPNLSLPLPIPPLAIPPLPIAPTAYCLRCLLLAGPFASAA